MSSLNKSIAFIIALTPVLMASECGIPDYGTAHTANETAYLAKPAFTDTSASAIYASAGFSHTTSPNYADERIYFGELLLHRSHTWRYHNLSYGVFGYAGSYRIREVEKYKGDKFFGGFGATGEYNINVPFRKVDWRIIGVRTTMFYEDGRYASFRKMAERDTLIENVNRYHGAFNVSACYEVLVKLEELNFGFHGSIGSTYGIKDKPIIRDTSSVPATVSGERRNSLTSNWGFQLTHRQMTYFAQFSTGAYQGISVSGGITYRIKYKMFNGRNRKMKSSAPANSFQTPDKEILSSQSKFFR